VAATGVPPGWPSDLPPAVADEFEARVGGWLLDRCPPEVRASFTIRRHPIALAHVAAAHCEAVVAGQREAYRSARRELAESLPAEAVAGVLTDLEAVGHALVRNLREVHLVAEALAGRVWRE
jgi:hypothetical protein